MGGGAKQNDPGVASKSSAAADAAAQASASLSRLNQSEQEALFNQFFGKPGSPEFGHGSLSKFMDPENLNVTGKSLQGPYEMAWNNIQDKIGKNFAFARGSLRQGMANRGFTAGMPSGFQEEQERKLGRDEADTRGDNYTALLGEGYKDALSNFWNAHNIASGQAAGAREGALAGSKDAGQTEANLYGTAGAFHQTPSLGGAIAQGAGTAGAGLLSNASLFCPARGAKITLANGQRKPVELMKRGDKVLQMGGKSAPLLETPIAVSQQVVQLITAQHRLAHAGINHTFALAEGGYQYAGQCSVAVLDSEDGPDEVLRVIDKDEGGRELHDLVYPLRVGGNHTYLCDGIWSLE